MIDVALAEKLIEKMMEYTNYKLSIMNDQGIVIGSSDRGKIGTYHEVAHQIVSEKKNLVIVSRDNDYLGVRSGVNMPLLYKGRIVGVIEVTGLPEEARPVATLARMAIETVLELDRKKESVRQRQDAESQLVQLLLFGDESDQKEIATLADQLHLRDDVHRVPILCRLDDQTEPEALLKAIRSDPAYNRQDISATISRSHLIMFKYIPASGPRFFLEYRAIIGGYLANSAWQAPLAQGLCRCLVGSVQDSIEGCRKSYRHCTWLEANVEAPDTAVVYFYDHADRYLRNQIPLAEMRRVFGAFQSNWSESFISNYIEVIGSLLHNNYNLVAASKEMFIHKNTLIFRLDKIREALGMDPLHDINARRFMNYLFYFLRGKI